MRRVTCIDQSATSLLGGWRFKNFKSLFARSAIFAFVFTEQNYLGPKGWFSLATES